MIDALQQLKSNLEAKPTRGRSYEIISYIVDACLQRDDVYEKLTFEAATLLHCCGTAAEREMDPQKWMPSISVLQKALNLTQTSEATFWETRLSCNSFLTSPVTTPVTSPPVTGVVGGRCARLPNLCPHYSLRYPASSS